jgi:hypothetical protein
MNEDIRFTRFLAADSLPRADRAERSGEGVHTMRKLLLRTMLMAVVLVVPIPAMAAVR